MVYYGPNHVSSLISTHGIVAADDFKPSSTFTGSRPGFIFTTRNGVTGYYRDTNAPAQQQQQQTPVPPPAGTAAGAPKPTAAG